MKGKHIDNPRLGFIVVDYKPVQHASYDDAARERERLSEAHPGKQFRVMRVLNAGAGDIAAYNKIRDLLNEAAEQDALLAEASNAA